MKTNNEISPICEVKITGMGADALSFREQNMLILFSDQACNGVEDFSVQITMPSFTRDIAPSDTVQFGSEEYQVTAIGNEAMETFRLLGHCTLRFDGSEVAALPGTVHLCALHADKPRKFPKIEIGKIICFY